MNNMKKMTLMLALMVASAMGMSAKNALVVIAHGSPMPQWRKPVLDVEKLLQKEMADVKGFSYIRVAMMEFTEPTIASVVEDCEKQGVDTIYAIPLFMAPSGHSEMDIPNILGHKYDADTHSELVEENTKFVNTKLPIIVGPTLSYDDFLEKTMLKRVQEMSKDVKDEAVLFVAHGDDQFIGFWNQKMESISSCVKEATGISVTDYKFVAMGAKMISEMVPAIVKMSQQKPRVLVQGVYLTSSAKEMAEGFGVDEVLKEALPNKQTEVVFSANGILPASTNEVCAWIKTRATEWLNSK